MNGNPHLALLLQGTTFSRQINALVAVGVLLFAIASSLLISWQASQQIRETQLKQGLQIAENLASQSHLALLYASADNASEALKAALAFPDVKRAEVLQPGGQLLTGLGLAQMPADATTTFDATARNAYLASDTADGLRFVAPVLIRPDASQLDATEGREELLGFVQVMQGKETLIRTQQRVLDVNLSISLLFALILLLALGRLARRLTQPIVALSDSMARAGRGDLGVRAALTGSKDIVDMAAAFNHMIVALQDREKLTEQVRAAEAAHRETRLIAEREHAEHEQQQRFLTMLTHELKTPLSVIRMRLGSSQPSDNMQKHALTAIADIDNIVERVALTSRIEDRSLKRQQQICPLDEILAELLIQTAQAARVRLALAADVDALRLCTDPLLLRTIMANLLDNALKYAPPAATVHVTVSEQARTGQPGLIIRVENPIGPAGQPDPAQVFSKYYRAPLAHRQSGSGLGLYIVQELVRQLCGQIGYLPGPSCVGFELWLPIQAKS